MQSAWTVPHPSWQTGRTRLGTYTGSAAGAASGRSYGSTDSVAKGKGNGDAWGVAVRDQLGGSPEGSVGTLTGRQKRENQRRWKRRVGYGRRWVVEIVFSAFKRMFGESVMASKWENMVHEIMLKVATYNLVTARGGWN